MIVRFFFNNPLRVSDAAQGILGVNCPSFDPFENVLALEKFLFWTLFEITLLYDRHYHSCSPFKVPSVGIRSNVIQDRFWLLPFEGLALLQIYLKLSKNLLTNFSTVYLFSWFHIPCDLANWGHSLSNNRHLCGCPKLYGILLNGSTLPLPSLSLSVVCLFWTCNWG